MTLRPNDCATCRFAALDYDADPCRTCEWPELHYWEPVAATAAAPHVVEVPRRYGMDQGEVRTMARAPAPLASEREKRLRHALVELHAAARELLAFGYVARSEIPAWRWSDLAAQNAAAARALASPPETPAARPTDCKCDVYDEDDAASADWACRCCGAAPYTACSHPVAPAADAAKEEP